MSIGAAILGLMPMSVAAQDDSNKAVTESTAPLTTEVFRLDASARVDWQYHRPFDRTDNSATGFKGRYFMLRMDGKITDGLTYSWRQRLNKGNGDQTFFDATDWVYLSYTTEGWTLQAGKEIVAIGGWEYDRAPIDLYGCSVFWNNIPCYQLGASAGYNFTKADRLTAQVTQSPFFTTENTDMYAYNLMWNGHHGCFDAIWSANLLEYTRHKYISYFALGNRFTAGKCVLEVDLMNRASSAQTYFFKDCSVMAELAYTPDSRWRVHAKGTYDVNHSGTGADLLVLDGTELTMAGAGVEFFPLMKDKSLLRLHANAYYSWGRNANSADLMQSRTVLGSVGITWYMNILSLKKQ